MEGQLWSSRALTLARLLRERRGELIREWEQSVRAQGLLGGEAMDRRTLAGELPALLLHMAESVEAAAEGRPRPVSSPEAAGHAVPGDHDLHEVLAGYAILRKVIARRCLEEAPDLGPAELSVVHEVLDDAVASTARRFASVQEPDRREAGQVAALEAALRTLEQRYRLATRASSDAIWDWDLVTDALTWSEGIERISGFTPAELGPDAKRWASGIHPEERARVLQQLHAVLDGGGERWESEYRFRRVDGEYIVVTDHGTVERDENGRALRIAGAMKDVTAQREAEQKLQLSEERLRVALEAASLGTWDLDPTTGVLSWDERSRALFGLAPEVDPSLEVWTSRVHPEDRELAARAVRQALDPAGSGSYDTMYRTVRLDDGLEHWVRAIGRAFFEGGRAVRFVGTIQDITRYKAAEEALQRSERDFRLLTEAMPQLVWMAAPDGQLDYVNPRLEEYVGVPAEEALGSRWLAFTHPEDRPRVLAAWRRSVAAGELFDVEQRLRRHDGTYRWYLTRGVPIRDEQGRVIRWLGTGTDISELKSAQETLQRSEQELRTVTDAMPQLVWTARADGRLDYVNTRLADYLGERADAFLESRWEEVIHPDDRAAFEPVWSKAIATGQPFERERRLRRGDGTYRWFLTRAVPMRDARGRVRKWLGTSTDIDDLKRAEAELRRRAEIEQQLIGIVSHDLRNPLNVVLLSAETLLRADGLSERQVRTIHRLHAAAQRAARLTRDLLDFTRVRLGGGLTIERRPLDLHAAVKAVLEEVRAAHPQRRIELRTEGDGRGVWDADRLAQVVINLVANAVAYSAPETPILVETRDEGPAVSLSVNNEGAPIAPELLPHLFKPMRRGTGGSAAAGNIGLGLFIVDSVVRAHAGEIEVRSTGEGTTFRVVLPRVAPEPASAPGNGGVDWDAGRSTGL